MIREDESRPAGNWTAQEVISDTNDYTEDAAVAFFRNSYAVLVRGKCVRRHLYFNLPAAQRAVERALARGDRADLVLVRLVPVDSRHLDGVSL